MKLIKSMKTMKILIPTTFVLMTALTGCNNSEIIDASTSGSEAHSSAISPAAKTPPMSRAVEEISQEDFLGWQDSDGSAYTLIDVRTPEEFASGHIKGAINIPHDQILHDTRIVSKYADRPVVIYCRSGSRAGKVSEVLEQNKLSDNVYHLSGDILGWQEAKLPLVTE